MAAVIRRYEITDEELEQIKPYIPEDQDAGSRGRPSRDSRTMLNGIFWILRSGAAWRDLPERYGPWQTVYKRFVKWSEAGIFEKIFKDLATDAETCRISALTAPVSKPTSQVQVQKKRNPDCPKADPKDNGKRERFEKNRKRFTQTRSG